MIHDHEGIAGVAATGLGKIGIGSDKGDYCEGKLILRHDRVVFQGRPTFNQPLSAIAEVKTNRLSIRGKPGFHIKFKNGDNYNFGAVSGDAAEIVSAIETFRRIPQ